jgi:hypothetical protein
MLISVPSTRLSAGGRGVALCYKIQMEIILGVEGVTLGQLVQEHYLNAFSELFLLQSF